MKKIFVFIMILFMIVIIIITIFCIISEPKRTPIFLLVPIIFGIFFWAIYGLFKWTKEPIFRLPNVHSKNQRQSSNH